MLMRNSCSRDITHLSITYKDINDDLIIAAIKGKKDEVMILLSKGANINHRDNRGMTALVYVLQNGYVEVAELLIEKGADVNAKNIKDWTPLIIVSKNGNLKIAERLIEEGANIYVKDNFNETVLIHISENLNKSNEKVKKDKFVQIAYIIIKKWRKIVYIYLYL